MFLGKYEEIIAYYDNYFVAKKHPSVRNVARKQEAGMSSVVGDIGKLIIETLKLVPRKNEKFSDNSQVYDIFLLGFSHRVYFFIKCNSKFHCNNFPRILSAFRNWNDKIYLYIFLLIQKLDNSVRLMFGSTIKFERL